MPVSTLYRTLSTLEEVGIVSFFNFTIAIAVFLSLNLHLVLLEILAHWQACAVEPLITILHGEDIGAQGLASSSSARHIVNLPP